MGAARVADSVRFTKMADGREIAYRVMSETAGPVVLHTHGVTVPIEILDEDPMYDRFLRVLGKFTRLVIFDKPGIGASDPFDRNRDYLDQTIDAYLAVLDALDARDGWLVGHGACETALLATSHRSRLLGAALLEPYSPNGPVPFDLAASFADRHRDDPAVLAPSRSDDSGYRTWLRRGKRMGSSGVDAREYQEALARSVQRVWAAAKPIADAPPVMIIHRRYGLDISHLRWWNRIFPEAECVTIEGADITIAALDAGIVAEAMGGFVTGTPIEAPVERQLLAVLFTDLVDSTVTAATAGDTKWKQVLDRHDRITRLAVARCNGEVVKWTGDGSLAVLPSATAAIDAAVAVRDQLHDAGLAVRIGVHVGEIDSRGGDVSGLAVNTAARIMSKAAAGQILVSAIVPPLIGDSGRNFDEQDTCQLKGVPGTWTLWSLANP